VKVKLNEKMVEIMEVQGIKFIFFFDQE